MPTLQEIFLYWMAFTNLAKGPIFGQPLKTQQKNQLISVSVMFLDLGQVIILTEKVVVFLADA
jgi:hypothetical protein